MLDAEPLGDGADGRLLFERQALDGEQELMLLRLDAYAARRLLAEGEEAAELVAKRRERAVVGRGELGHPLGIAELARGRHRQRGTRRFGAGAPSSRPSRTPSSFSVSSRSKRARSTESPRIPLTNRWRHCSGSALPSQAT